VRALRRFRYRLRALLERGRLEREMDAELRLHLELETEKNVQRGMPPEQARRAAAVSFGGLEPKKEDVRDSWGMRWLEGLGHDLRFGLRNLARHPGYTLVVVATLALGIGANASVFSVVRGVLLRPLPYERGEQVVLLRQSDPRAGIADIGFSVAEVEDYRLQNATLDSVVEYHSMNFTLLGGSEPQRVRTGVVSADFFRVLEVKPLLGRTFRPEEDAHDAEPVLVLSYDYWIRRQGGDPGIVGRRFEMNDRVHTVVGVLPPLPEYPDDNDVFMPASACPFRARGIENRRARMLQAFGRVKPGVDLEQARADLAVVGERLRQQHPDAYPPQATVQAVLAPLKEELIRGARPTVLILFGTVALILLIACANVANLALARINERSREIAIRASLGASRSRLLRQLLTESTLLALCGGALGLLLAVGTRELLVSFASRFTPRAAEIRIDTGVLLFTLVISVVTGLVFGSLPGLPRAQALARADLGEGTRTTASRSRQRLRSALVVWQVALSFMLVIGAALMLRSFAKLQQVEAGFSVENVLTMSVDLNWSTYATPRHGVDQARALRLHEELQRSVRAVPGVIAGATSWTFPLNAAFSNNGTFQVEGRDPSAAAPPRAQFVGASADYFGVVGVPVLAGRVFEERDRPPQPGVVIVSRGLARRHFGQDDAVGRRLSGDGGRTWRTIVGVVGDVRQTGLEQEPPDIVYLPFLEFPGFSSILFVRTQGDPLLAAEHIRRSVHQLDPQAAVSGIRSLEQIRHESLSSPRLTTLLLGLVAALALSLSAAGIGGVIAYSVSQRTQEIGIRMAMGAERRRVLAMVLGQGLRPIAAGLGLGLLGALALGRVMADLLFGIQPTDPMCLGGSAAVLLTVSVAACLLPARRATRIEPMLALRAEGM
jgi:putative ABC transport system permease protein